MNEHLPKRVDTGRPINKWEPVVTNVEAFNAELHSLRGSDWFIDFMIDHGVTATFIVRMTIIAGDVAAALLHNNVAWWVLFALFVVLIPYSPMGHAEWLLERDVDRTDKLLNVLYRHAHDPYWWERTYDGSEF